MIRGLEVPAHFQTSGRVRGAGGCYSLMANDLTTHLCNGTAIKLSIHDGVQRASGLVNASMWEGDAPRLHGTEAYVLQSPFRLVLHTFLSDCSFVFFIIAWS